MPSFKLPAPGASLHKVEKQAAENICYQIDLNDILDKNEIIVAIQVPTYSVPITQFRSRKGKFIEITVPAIEIVGASPFQESKVVVKYVTNTGNARIASFLVKAFR